MAEYKSKYTRKEIEETLDSFLGLDTNGYEYVDMGEAGVWAKYPIGVTEWNGDYINKIKYFAWGDTEGYTKSQVGVDKNFSSDFKDYKFAVEGSTFNKPKLTKYCTDKDFGKDGFIDNLVTLLPEDDACVVNMGGDWRIPTQSEFQKLYDNCNNEWVTNYNGITGLNGILLKLKSDETKELFLCTTGSANSYSVNWTDSLGYLWSSSLEIYNSGRAHGILFESKGLDVYSFGSRYCGMPVIGILDSLKEKYLTKNEASNTYYDKKEVDNFRDSIINLATKNNTWNYSNSNKLNPQEFTTTLNFKIRPFGDMSVPIGSEYTIRFDSDIFDNNKQFQVEIKGNTGANPDTNISPTYRLTKDSNTVTLKTTSTGYNNNYIIVSCSETFTVKNLMLVKGSVISDYWLPAPEDLVTDKNITEVLSDYAKTTDIVWNKKSNNAIYQKNNIYISNSTTLGQNSVSESYGIATGNLSHAEGQYTQASGGASHAEGFSTITNNSSEHAEGQFNNSIRNSNTDYTIHTVGNGEAIDRRHNAHQIMLDGTHYIPDVYATKEDGTTYEYYKTPMINLQEKLRDLGETSEKVNDLEAQVKISTAGASVNNGTLIKLKESVNQQQTFVYVDIFANNYANGLPTRTSLQFYIYQKDTIYVSNIKAVNCGYNVDTIKIFIKDGSPYVWLPFSSGSLMARAYKRNSGQTLTTDCVESITNSPVPDDAVNVRTVKPTNVLMNTDALLKVDLATSVTTLDASTLPTVANVGTLILRYNGVVQEVNTYIGTPNNWLLIYVPAAQANAYCTKYPTLKNYIRPITGDYIDDRYALAANVYTKEEIESTYAKQDGNYPKLISGAAYNLEGLVDRVSDSAYHPVGDDIDVKNGVAELLNIKGNSVVWNQLVTNESNSGFIGTSTIEHGRNGYDLFLKATNVEYAYGGVVGGPLTNAPILANHKYLIRVNKIKVNKGSIDYGHMSIYRRYKEDGSLKYAPVHTLKTLTSSIYNNTTDGDGFFYGSTTLAAGKGNELDISVEGVNIFDLTLIYGTGNEPTTVEQFENDYQKWFGKPLTYEEYDSGSIRPVLATGLKTVGFNQWDGNITIPGKYLYRGTEQLTTSEGYGVTDYIKVIPNATYYINQASGSNPGLAFYDSDKNYISGLYHSNRGTLLVTTPSNCAFIRDSVYLEDAENYCINLHWSGKRDGEYEPYWEETKALPITTLTSGGKVVFPDGMKRAGDVYDEIIVENNVTKAIKRVGSVDLETLTWSYVAEFNSFRAFLKGVTKNTTNLISSKFRNERGSTNRIYNANEYVLVNDNTYETNLTEFKKDIVGVTLYYELATPEVYEIDNFELPAIYKVDDFGTEEIIGGSVAPTLVTRYGINAVDTIRRLPDTYVTKTEADKTHQELLQKISDSGSSGTVTPLETEEVQDIFKYLPDGFYSIEGTYTGFFKPVVNPLFKIFSYGNGARCLCICGSYREDDNGDYIGSCFSVVDGQLTQVNNLSINTQEFGDQNISKWIYEQLQIQNYTIASTLQLGDDWQMQGATIETPFTMLPKTLTTEDDETKVVTKGNLKEVYNRIEDQFVSKTTYKDDDLASYIGCNILTNDDNTGSWLWIPTSKRLCVANISKSYDHIDWQGYQRLKAGRELRLIINNISENPITIDDISRRFISKTDSVTIEGNSFAELNIISDGTNNYVRVLQ